MGIPIRFATLPVPPDARESAIERFLAHSFFAWIGIRPLQAQHTEAEHAAIFRHAQNCKALVEIGVAEGASSVALAESMAPEGRLYLIDPFHLSRYPALNFLRRAAHRAVQRVANGRISWLERFSFEVSREWNLPIDFLLIDGDHLEQSVWRDWNEWHKFVVPGGVVLFHDARLFERGWTTPGYGPVRVVDALFRRANPAKWHIIDEVDSLVIVERQI